MTVKWQAENYHKSNVAERYIYAVFSCSQVSHYVLQEVGEGGFTIKEYIFDKDSEVYQKYKTESIKAEERHLVGFKRIKIKEEKL